VQLEMHANCLTVILDGIAYCWGINTGASINPK